MQVTGEVLDPRPHVIAAWMRLGRDASPCDLYSIYFTSGRANPPGEPRPASAPCVLNRRREILRRGFGEVRGGGPDRCRPTPRGELRTMRSAGPFRIGSFRGWPAALTIRSEAARSPCDGRLCPRCEHSQCGIVGVPIQKDGPRGQAGDSVDNLHLRAPARVRFARGKASGTEETAAIRCARAGLLTARPPGRPWAPAELPRLRACFAAAGLPMLRAFRIKPALAGWRM